MLLCGIFLLSCIASSFAYTPPSSQTVGQPWPMPQTFTQTDDTFAVTDFSFSFSVVGESCDILESAMQRYYGLIFYPPMSGRSADTVMRFKPYKLNKANEKLKPYQTTKGTDLSILKLNLQKPCEKYPSLHMDEAYELNIAASGGELTSDSIWGILRGLETFSQIVYEGPDGGLVVNATSIKDAPRFTHRGILLDTSRHYLSLETILQNLDAMAYNKINVFHWHIVDDQSFPYQSRDYPNLSAKGAYDPYSHIYTQADIRRVIEYARMRGIRVVPEFDSPGHSESWGPGQPGLLTPCYSAGKPDGSFGPINPIVNTTFDFLRGFMKELTEVFPDKYIHLGGDEVSFSCWQSNPDVLAFMQKMQFGTNFSKLEQYYMQQLLNIVGSYDSGYTIWQEVIDNGCTVRPDTVVHVWKGGYQNELAKVTAKGFNALLSSPWYLDYISTGSDWKNYYAVEPLAFNGTEAQKGKVMGGEACLWGEWVDSTNAVSRLWPRASAIAERLWSAATVNDVGKAQPRFEENRCRMIVRGLNPEPQDGPSFCKYEYKPVLFP